MNKIDTNPITKIIKGAEETSQIFGLDRNMIFVFFVLAIMVLFIYYLYHMIKRIRDDIKVIKSRELDNEVLSEKIEYSNESVKAMEIKFEQIINEMNKKVITPEPVKRKISEPELSDDESDDGIIRSDIKNNVIKL